jgi:glucose/arabinose dehydrogenase
MRIASLAAVLLAVPAFAQAPAPAQVHTPPINPATVHRSVLHNFRAVTVADGLENPWSIAFIPGGDILITERAGRLRLVRNGTLRPEAIAGVPTVRTGGQGGLLDVVLHPNFASNKLVYLSYAKTGTGADSARGTTAVARGRWENDRLNDVKEIFEANLWSNGRGHHGSRLAFDRNGVLFITLGDRQVPSEGDLTQHPAQLLTTHHGKIIRLHDDGRVPADNPFVGQTGPLPETFSYGHRSVQGLAIHPVSGEIFASEHGPQGGDEINILAAGKNYGWPVIGFGVNYRTGTAIHSGTMKAGMEQPAHIWVPSIGTSGLLWYTGDKFPEWKGSLFAGGMVGQQLVRLTQNASGRGFSDVEIMFRNMGRIRDVRQSLDGFIYLAFDGQQGAKTAVVRLEPVSR